MPMVRQEKKQPQSSTYRRSFLPNQQQIPPWHRGYECCIVYTERCLEEHNPNGQHQLSLESRMESLKLGKFTRDFPPLVVYLTHAHTQQKSTKYTNWFCSENSREKRGKAGSLAGMQLCGEGERESPKFNTQKAVSYEI